MTELVTISMANHLMLAVLVLAPVIGVVWGALLRRPVKGIVIGLIVGVGNYALWTVYNAITDRLGLDTVKNLLVNLALFIVLGVIAGIVIGRYNKKSEQSQNSEVSN